MLRTLSKQVHKHFSKTAKATQAKSTQTEPA